MLESGKGEFPKMRFIFFYTYFHLLFFPFFFSFFSSLFFPLAQRYLEEDPHFMEIHVPTFEYVWAHRVTFGRHLSVFVFSFSTFLFLISFLSLLSFSYLFLISSFFILSLSYLFFLFLDMGILESEHVNFHKIGSLLNDIHQFQIIKHSFTLVPSISLFLLFFFTFLYFSLTWAYLEEAPDKLDNGQVNFHKMGLIGSLLNDIHQFQIIKHSFTLVPSLQEFITLSLSAAMDEDQLYTISKTLEPRKEIWKFEFCARIFLAGKVRGAVSLFSLQEFVVLERSDGRRPVVHYFENTRATKRDLKIRICARIFFGGKGKGRVCSFSPRICRAALERSAGRRAVVHYFNHASHEKRFFWKFEFAREFFFGGKGGCSFFAFSPRIRHAALERSVELERVK
jgi:hypothetical protein